MFKDTKTLVTKVVDTAAAPIITYQQAVSQDPDLLVPMAIVHMVPVALAIIGTTEVIKGRLRLKVERERTKQIKLQAKLGSQRPGGHPGCRHHRHIHQKGLMTRHHELPEA